MQQYAFQRTAFVSERKESVVCPKPRRLNAAPVRPPLRWHLCDQAELSDSKSGSDLLDILLTKGVEQSCSQIGSSPPYFSGSPPSRVSNPLIQDARFRDEMESPPPQVVVVSSSPARKVSCDFGNNPRVRVEGFDCLSRDSRNCGIPTMA